MNAVIYYSNTNECYNVAKYISDKTNYELLSILNLNNYIYNNIYLIIPVHYQSIPLEIREVIKKIKSSKAIIIACYGKMSYGNILNEIKNSLNSKVVGACLIPSKHTYIKNDTGFSDYSKLDILFNKMNNEEEIYIPKTPKNVLSNVFPILRHQLGIKIIKNDKCTNCGECNNICNHINCGVVDRDCNRCLKCIDYCKEKALDFKIRPLMKLYLKKKKKNELIIY